jgi:hypothetical protein
MRAILLSMSLALLPFAGAAAQTPSAAEAAFRDAWWAESGRGDLPEALRGYLASAAADGPEKIRARALLAAGEVQQRLGKAESSIATFKQLLRDFPAQAELVEQARVHLRELTAVDLRDGYDEWYERRLFSEDTQVLILEQIEKLGAKLHEPVLQDNDAARKHGVEVQAQKNAILRYGKGAVPALRHAVESRDAPLAECAVSMLFELGELPSYRVLAATAEWCSETKAWARILAGSAAERGTKMAAPQAADPHVAGLLAAAWTSPQALLQRLLEPEVDENGVFAQAAARALALQSPALLGEVVARSCDAAVPFLARYELQTMFAEDSDDELARRLDLAQWLQLGKDPVIYQLRGLAARNIATRLRAKDGEVLDEIVARIQAMPEALLPELATQLVQGLQRNPAPMQIPWSLSRLQRFFVLALRTEETLSPLFRDAMYDAQMTSLLAEAVLPVPAELTAALAAVGDASVERLGSQFRIQVNDERDAMLLAARWAAVLARRLTDEWPKWDEKTRSNAVPVLRAVVPGAGDRSALAKVFDQLQEGSSEALRPQLQALAAQCR